MEEKRRDCSSGGGGGENVREKRDSEKIAQNKMNMLERRKDE